MLASIKLAFDDIEEQIHPKCMFYCARGADLYFTKVIEKTIAPVKEAVASEENFHRFYPDGGRAISELYAKTRRPLADVGEQFRITGGTRDVGLVAVDAVFYVAGVSPYDFARLGERPIPVSRSLRHELLSRILDEQFLLRQHVLDIKSQRPDCKHYFIGSPLAATHAADSREEDRASVRRNRATTQLMAKNYLFDDVFMPGEDLLDDSLMSTKTLYCSGGREEAESFQNVSVTKSDNTHMNKNYGRVVWDKFILPIVQPLG